MATVFDVGVPAARTRRVRRGGVGLSAGRLTGLFGALFVGGLVALTLAMPAQARSSGTTSDSSNSLQSINPADGEALAASPAGIVLSFNQELKTDDFPSLVLTCAGTPQDTGIAERDPDNLIVTFAIRHDLPRGVCIVQWKLTDALGATIVNGESTFRIDADPQDTASVDAAATTATTTPGAELTYVTVPPIQNTDTTDQGNSNGALWLGRVLSTLGIMVVFGSLALISVGWPEGPEYIVTVRFLRTAWAIAVLGSILYVIAYAADFDDLSFGAALSPTKWLDLTDAGWAGRGALLRLVLVAVAGLVALRPERIIDPTSAMWAWLVPAAATASVALGRVSGPATLVGVALGVGHVLGAAVWFGGAALVARVVLAGPGDEDLVQATRTFSRISVPAIVLTCLTGVGQMVRLDGGELFSSGHGRVVLLKAIAVAVMIFVALAARQQVGLRLARSQELSAQQADRFRRAFGAEATLGVVVLAFSGWLLALTPPTADPLANEKYLPAIPFVDPVAGLDVKVYIGPGKVGRNGLKVIVNAPDTGLSNLELLFTPPASAPPEAQHLIKQPLPNTGAGTSYLYTSAGIPLLASGIWEVELSGVTPNGTVEGMHATFLVSESDGTVTTEPATQSTSNVQVTLVENSQPTAEFATTTTTTLPLVDLPLVSTAGG